MFISIGDEKRGTREFGPGKTRTYVRDPDTNEFTRKAAVSRFVRETRLPRDARFSGYRRGDVEVWVSKRDEDEAIYVRVDGSFERWPRVINIPRCA